MRRRSMWRRNWPWLVGSVAAHVLLLAAMPGLDRDERCPVMLLVTLQAPAQEAEPQFAPVAPPPPVVAQPAPPPPQPARQRPTPPREERSAAQPLLARSMQVQQEQLPTPIQHLPRREPQPEPAEDAPVQVQTQAETPAPLQTQAETPVPVNSPPQSAALPGDTQSETPSPPVDVEALRRGYAQAARARIGAAQYVPDAARSPENAGRVVQVKVKVAIQPSGALGSVSIQSASGIAALDEAALNAVRRAAPFGAFPQGLTTPLVQFVVPLQYTIR